MCLSISRLATLAALLVALTVHLPAQRAPTIRFSDTTQSAVGDSEGVARALRKLGKVEVYDAEGRRLATY